MHPGPSPASRCAILAGGASRRMGRPKARVELAGRPLLAYPVAGARAAGLEPVVVAKRGSELPDCGVRRIDEPPGPLHPLTGIVAALEDARAPIVVCPCDAPELPGELLAALAARPEPLVVARAEARVHPLVGRYAPELLPGLLRARDRGRSATAAVQDLGATYLEGPELERFGEPDRILANVNTPAELEAARDRIAG